MTSDAPPVTLAPDELSATLASLMASPSSEGASWAERGIRLAHMLVQSQADWLERLADTDDLTLLRNAKAADLGHKALFEYHGLFPGQRSSSAQPAQAATMAFLNVARKTRDAQLREAVRALRQLSASLTSLEAPQQLESILKSLPILETLPPSWFSCHPNLKD